MLKEFPLNWALLPDCLISLEQSQTDFQLKSSLEERSTKLQVAAGVAVISVQGIITKDADAANLIFNNTCSLAFVDQQFDQALKDSKVSSIVFHIDSPGGTIDGVSEMAEKIFNHRKNKPIVAFSNGMIASAAYWLASACEKIFITGKTNLVGSIGVYTTHRDYSKLELDAGVISTDVFAGKYKRIASPHEPLSKEGKQSIQDRVDYLYSIFIESVCQYRGKSEEEVLKMADGKIFIGQQAIDIGLVDAAKTIREVIAQDQKNSTSENLAQEEPSFFEKVQSKVQGLSPTNQQPKEENMTKEEQEQFDALASSHDALASKYDALAAQVEELKQAQQNAEASSDEASSEASSDEASSDEALNALAEQVNSMETSLNNLCSLVGVSAGTQTEPVTQPSFSSNTDFVG